MDLVDIDQVLDNLELREATDEKNKALAQQQQSIQSVTASNNGYAAAAHSAPHRTGLVGGGSAPSYQPSKSFVGVSQVFNSLDEYCKNVESLQKATLNNYDDEFRPMVSTNFKQNSLDGPKVGEPLKTILDCSKETYNSAGPGIFPPTANEVVNSINTDISRNNEEQKQLQHQYQQQADSDGYEQNDDEDDNDDDDDDDDEDEDDDEATNDIQKFTERRRGNKGHPRDDAEDNTTTTSSDSLTTSSCSTFSSGPSLGLASTTDEQQSAATSPVDAEEQSALLTAQEEDQEHEEEQNPEEEDEGISESEQEVEVDELASGLSSIAITTGGNSQLNYPPEATASLVFESVLATTTTSPISQFHEKNDPITMADSNSIVAIPSSFLESEPPPQKLDDCDGEAPINNEVPDEQKLVADALRHHQQPITFGSTMDEISDTELDSMLQEMDIDELSDQPNSKTSASNQEETITIQKIPSPIPKQEAKVDMDSDELDNIPSSNGVDCANADSFSQASTVEFAEIKTQPMPITQLKESEQPTASLASSYTSSESSLDGDVIADNGEMAEEVEGEVGDIQQRPQRPTTLDLPTVKTSLYTHAGQTPPGVNAIVPGNDAMEGDSSTRLTEQAAIADGNVAINTSGAHDGVAPNEIEEASGYSDPHANLGKFPPIWVPDNMATGCMQCHTKFTMIKRRHHCRACGKVLCSVCCSQKFKLEFLPNPESRVCVQCYLILTQRQDMEGSRVNISAEEARAQGATAGATAPPLQSTPTRSPNPNPNNPMEYCSTIPPHRQVSNTTVQPPSVIVPVSVLKRSNSNPRKRKSVMFSDGIAPGSDLANLENQWAEPKHARRVQQQSDKSRSQCAHKPPTPAKAEPITDATTMGLVAQLFRGSIPPSAAAATVSAAHSACETVTTKRSQDHHESFGNSPSHYKADNKSSRTRKLPPSGCDEQGCFIPKDKHSLPPIYIKKDDSNCDFEYKEVTNNYELMERLQREPLKFALENNFFVHVKIVNLQCCMNRIVINFTTSGMHHVGNDEIIILLEFEPPTSKEMMLEPPIPKDIFQHLYEIYHEAEQGNPIAELSFTSPRGTTFLGTTDYGGFIYIRATFQCLQDVIVPENPFLIGILIHRYEVPWAKVFPLRLMLRLGAQYRYYPCPHISMRNRESVYAEIAQTIINFLADFRNFSYTLPYIRGMYIHMEDRQTTVMIPRNRQEDVIKAINNSSDHILAFGGNFSKTADGHLVCMQNVNDDQTEMYSYSTQAINIQGQPRKVTGASFFVLNEALKSTSGLSGKCSIVEDGLMVQILPSKMEEVRNALRNQTDIDIVCGPLNADEQHTEVVSIKWVENDRDFNVGVVSPIDNKSMEGISSMRVHASFNYSNSNYSIRLTDIFMIKFDEWYSGAQSSLANTSIDLTRIAEQIARSASMALVPFLDLLAASGNLKLGLRATLHQDNVCYEAGARGNKLPPLYMNALDNHLIATLLNESAAIEDEIILELLFYILNV